MQRTLVALALALGATAASATPTLELYGDERNGWKQLEMTVYQSSGQRKDYRDPRNDYPWNP